MLGVEFGLLAQTSVLRTIGRKLLSEFLAKFHDELRTSCVPIPDPDSTDEEFFTAVAAMLCSPGLLPDRLSEAILTIEEMASDENRERLDAVIAHAGLDLTFDPDSPPERVTLQVWLHSPDLVYREHCKHDAAQLTSFQCFAPDAAMRTSRPVCIPDETRLQALTVPLVLWFDEHQRGMHTTRVDFHVRDHAQLWFLVRHGDTARWTRKIKGEETEFIRFTLENEEAILFCAEQDELWISARAEDERELYRTHFGLSLRGNSEYFSLRRNFTLDPLRTDGADALDPAGIVEISNLTLRQIQVRWQDDVHDFRTANAKNLFDCLSTSDQANITSLGAAGILTRAALLVEFADSPTRREIEICRGHTISLQRPSDLGAIARWLSKTKFNAGEDVISGAERAAC